MADSGQKLTNWCIGLYLAVCAVPFVLMTVLGPNGDPTVMLKNVWSPTSDPVFNALWNVLVFVGWVLLIPGMIVIVLVILAAALALLIPVFPFMFLGKISITGTIIGIACAVVGYGALIWATRNIIVDVLRGSKVKKAASFSGSAVDGGAPDGLRETRRLGEISSKQDERQGIFEKRDQPQKEGASGSGGWGGQQLSQDFLRGYVYGSREETPAEGIAQIIAGPLLSEEFLAGQKEGARDRVSREVKERWVRRARAMGIE